MRPPQGRAEGEENLPRPFLPGSPETAKQRVRGGCRSASVAGRAPAETDLSAFPSRTFWKALFVFWVLVFSVKPEFKSRLSEVAFSQWHRFCFPALCCSFTKGRGRGAGMRPWGRGTAVGQGHSRGAGTWPWGRDAAVGQGCGRGQRTQKKYRREMVKIEMLGASGSRSG